MEIDNLILIMIDQKIEKIKKMEIGESVKEKVIKSIIAFQPVNDELISRGFPDKNEFDNENDYYMKVGEINQEYLDIILKWYPTLKYYGTILSVFDRTQLKIDAKVLREIFDNGDNAMRWRVCDLIDRRKCWWGIEKWIVNIFLSSNYSYSEVGLLPLIIAKMLPKSEARGLLKQGFDLHPELTPVAIGMVGTSDDISFLEEKRQKKYDADFVYKEIEKAIKKIMKRNK